MRFAYNNFFETDGILTASSEYSAQFPVRNVTDRRLGKKWRSYRAPNLMKNADCDSEDSPSLDSTISVAVNATWEIDYTNKYSGDASWKLTKTSAAGAGVAYLWLQNGAGTTDMHGLTKGKTYEMLMRMSVDATTVGNVKMRVYEYYAAAWNLILLLTCSTQNIWEFLRGKFTINSATTGFLVQLSIETDETSSTSVNVDSIKFFASNDQIEFGNCESVNSPTLDGTPVAPADATWARSAVQKYEGAYSWVLTKTSASGGGTAYQQLADNTLTTDKHDLVAGATYKLIFWGYTNVATAANAMIMIYEYYAAAWNATSIPCTQLSTWHKITKEITINPATTGILCRAQIATIENAGKLLYIDLLSCVLQDRIFIDARSGNTLAPTCASIICHNSSSTAGIKLQGNTSNSWDTPAVEHTLTWDADLILKFISATPYRFWSILIDDPDNEDGYVEVGYASIGTYLQSTKGPARIFTINPDDKSIVQETESGGVLGSDGNVINEYEINVPWWTLDMVNSFLAMYNVVKKYRPLIFILDENNLALFAAKFCRFTKYDFTHIMKLAVYAAKFGIRECK